MIEHYHFHEISSTNDYIKELLEDNEKVIVTADVQQEGRGRQSKKWHGLSGENVYFSYGVRHQSPPSANELSLYQATGCIVAHDALVALCGKDIFKLKYPNDIMVKTENGYRKICGVLVEHSFSGSACQTSVIGIGINVNQCNFPEGLSEKATSLKCLGYQTTPAEVINHLTDIIGRHIYRPTEEIFELWEKRLNIVGKEIRLVGRDGRWAATYLYSDGRLKIENLDTNESMAIGDGESFRYDYE